MCVWGQICEIPLKFILWSRAHTLASPVTVDHSGAGNCAEKSPRSQLIHTTGQECAHIVSGHLNLRIESFLVLVPEWRITNQQDVQNHSTRPDIHRLAVLLSLDNLW